MLLSSGAALSNPIDSVERRMWQAVHRVGVARPPSWESWRPAHVTFHSTIRLFLAPVAFRTVRYVLALPLEWNGCFAAGQGPFEYLRPGYRYNVEGLRCAACDRPFGDREGVQCEQRDDEPWRWIHAETCPDKDAPPATCEPLSPYEIGRIAERRGRR